MLENISRSPEVPDNVISKRIHRMDKDMRLTTLSIFVGILGGLSAIVFRHITDFIHYLLMDGPRDVFGESIILTVLAPTLGGLIVGSMIYYLADGLSGFDGPEMMKAVNIHGGLMRIRISVVKFLTSAVTIGSGGSSGREAPIAHFGGGLASYLSQLLALNPEERKTLVIAGVSAGISATFNTPIGGVLYGLEVVRKDQHSYPVIPLLISSVIGTAIGRTYFGASPAFNFPLIKTRGIIDFPAFIVMGIILGILTVVWIYWFYLVELQMRKILIHPILLASLGGFMVGIIEIVVPDVSGYSYESMDEVFALKKVLQEVIIIGVAKMIATSITIGSGNSGGVFAPSFIIGGLFGSALGYLYVSLFSLDKSLVTVFALVGMAAFLAGTIRAPLTAIIMTSEMVNNFSLFVPLMFCVITSYFVSQWLSREDLYTLQLKRDNISLRDDYDLLEEIPVSEIMVKPIFVSPKDRLESVLNMMKSTNHTGFPVAQNGRLVGIITEHDVDKAIDTKPLEEWIVSEICTKNVISVIQSCPLSVAMMKMTESGINRFPVIDSKENHKLVGWITRSDVMKAYRAAKTDIKFWQHEDLMFEKINSGELEVSDEVRPGFE